MRQIRARWGTAPVTMAAALVLAAVQGTAAAGAATSGPAHNLAPSDGPRWSANLLADGNAGAGYCTRDWNAATTIPGWVIRTGSPNVMCYSTARVGHPAGAAGPGFFSSGPYGDSAILLEAILRFGFDTLLVALNAADAHRLSFASAVLPEAARRGLGIIG
ncbi:MAG: hypothetical protein ACR2MP_09760, partial [Streptosporangiaceae bacterium]